MNKTDINNVKNQIWVFDSQDNSVELFLSKNALDFFSVLAFQVNTIFRVSQDDTRSINEYGYIYPLMPKLNLTEIGSEFYYVDMNENSGYEINVYNPTDILSSDGTTNNPARMLVDINTENTKSLPVNFNVFNNNIYFGA